MFLCIYVSTYFLGDYDVIIAIKRTCFAIFSLLITNHPEMPRLSVAERNQIVGMHLSGRSCRDIASSFPTSKSSVHKVLQKFATDGTVNDRPRSGRPKKTTANEDQRILQLHEEHPFFPVKQTANDQNVHPSTIRRRLKQGGLKCRRPYIGSPFKEHHRESRLEWCRDKDRWFGPQWDAVLFSDESKFNVSFADGRLSLSLTPTGI